MAHIFESYQASVRQDLVLYPDLFVQILPRATLILDLNKEFGGHILINCCPLDMPIDGICPEKVSLKFLLIGDEK